MKINTIKFLVICIAIASCNNNPEPASDKQTDLIAITKAQFDSEKMVLGEPSLKPFVDVVHVTGTIIPSVDGHAQISVPVNGTINKIHCKPGQLISKGSVMFDISGNDFIDLQKDFAGSSAIVSRLKSEYLRTKELYDDQIAIQKDFILAESNYLAENSKYIALKTKLESLGLDVSKIERGEFYLFFTIKSPIRGYVSNINATIGKYVEPNSKIAEIIDDNSLQLRLSVFEKNFYKIKTGLKVLFYLDGNKSVKNSAIINAVGKNIMPDSKSIECYAEIDKPQSLNIVINQFVEGEVYTAVDSLLSVPETAILKSENDSYLLLFEKEADSIYYFKRVKVTTGRKTNNSIELLVQLPSKKILVNGIYTIQVE